MNNKSFKFMVCMMYNIDFKAIMQLMTEFCRRSRKRFIKAILRIGKETTMNVAKLKDAIETLHEDLGEGLVATDIFSIQDGQSLVGFNPREAASALFAQVTKYLFKSLKDSGFPTIGRYYLIDLVDHKAVVVIPLGNHCWGILADSQKVPIGLVLNVALPKAISVFEEAVTG
jgi:hypothetical protein